MLTPEEIQSREFLVSLRGYDRDEVHAFLDRVAEQIRTLQSRLSTLEASQPAVAPSSGGEASAPGEMFAKIGQETHRILEAAHEAGAAIKRTARQEADKELQGARAEAARLIAEGERRRESIDELVGSLENSKRQLAEDLRRIGRSIEGSLRELLGDEAATTSVREALASEALPDDAEPPAPGEQEGAEDVAAEESPAPDDEPVAEAIEVPAESTGPIAAREAALSDLTGQLVRQIKRGLHDVQNVVLDRLRRADGRGELETFLPTDAELGDFSAGVQDVLGQAYSAGVRAGAELAAGDWPAPDAGRDLVDGFLVDAADRVRGALGATLRMGLEVGEDLGSLSTRVSAVFGEIKQASADEWATSHLVRCYELGQLDAWAAAGITHREWVVGPEPRCPEGRCRHNGQAPVVAMEQTFPSGHVAPPVHAGCTCTTVPVLHDGHEAAVAPQ